MKQGATLVDAGPMVAILNRILMEKYRDLPMDFADASLVRVAAREGIERIFTLDRRDFGLYRLPNRRRFQIFPETWT